MCLLYDGSTRRLTESGFMWFYGFKEKPGIEPATPGLQGIALIHYTTGALYRVPVVSYFCSTYISTDLISKYLRFIYIVILSQNKFEMVSYRI